MEFFDNIKNMTLEELVSEADDFKICKNSIKVEKQINENKIKIDIKNYPSTNYPNTLNNNYLLDQKIADLLNQGYVQTQVADMIGVSQSYVSKIKRANLTYPIRHLDSINNLTTK